MLSNKFTSLLSGENKIAIIIGPFILLALLVSACTTGQSNTEMAVEQTLTAVADQPDTVMAVEQTLTAVAGQPDTETAVEQALTTVAEQPNTEMVVEQTLTAVAEAVAGTQTAEAEAQSVFETAVAVAVATEVFELVQAGVVGIEAEVNEGTITPPPVDGEEVVGIATVVEQNVETRVADSVQLTAEAFETKASALIPPVGTGGAINIVIAIVTGADNVTVRSGPGEIYEIIGKLTPGEKKTVIGRSTDGWLNIFMDVLNDERGWVKEDFMEFTDSDTIADVTPVATVPPTPTPTRVFPTATPTSTPTSTATPTATPDPSISITLLNNSSSIFCRREIFLSIHSNGNDRLPNPLLPGAAITLKLEDGQGNYDARAWNCESVLVGEADDIHVFDGFTWVISDKQTSNQQSDGAPFVGFDPQPLTNYAGQ